MPAINLAEFEACARAVLPTMAYDYYASGANDEITLRENCEAYRRLQLAPRMLVDVSKRCLQTTIFGDQISMPVLIAPTAMQRMAHPDGEVAMVKAAGKAGTIMVLSTLSTASIEEVTAAASGPVWFQLYVYKDREITASLVKRAEKSGCTAIVLTVDSPHLGRRERDVRNCFSLPEGLCLANLSTAGLADLPKESADSGLAAYIASLYDTALTWADLQWLKSITKLPVLVKGILRVDDAERAIEYGAAGIIVSNHGGRQLDTVPATIDVLPAIAEACRGRAEVLVDGGVRRGTDVLKALALGARAVLIGRPALWGLAVGGEDGVASVLELLRQELDLSLMLSGCPDVNGIARDVIYRPGI